MCSRHIWGRFSVRMEHHLHPLPTRILPLFRIVVNISEIIISPAGVPLQRACGGFFVIQLSSSAPPVSFADIPLSEGDFCLPL